MLNIAVLVSGGGTNLQALLDSEARGENPNGKITLVVASKPGVYALERAAKAGVESCVVRRRDYDNSEDFDAALLGTLKAHNIDLVVLAALYTFLLVTPLYKATSTIYVVSRNDSVLNLSDIQIGSALTSDYIKVFEMWEVHEKVISALDLDYTYTQMDNMLSVTNANDTRMLDITVTDADPEEAAAIANKYAEVGASYIAEKMKTDEPTIMSSARVPANPFSPSKSKNILLGFLAGFVLSCGVVVLRVLLDDTYKSAEEIRKYTGMVVLASVPLVGGTEPKKGSNFQRRMKRLSKDIRRRVGGTGRKA